MAHHKNSPTLAHFAIALLLPPPSKAARVPEAEFLCPPAMTAPWPSTITFSLPPPMAEWYPVTYRYQQSLRTVKSQHRRSSVVSNILKRTHRVEISTADGVCNNVTGNEPPCRVVPPMQKKTIRNSIHKPIHCVGLISVAIETSPFSKESTCWHNSLPATNDIAVCACNVARTASHYSRRCISALKARRGVLETTT